MKTGPPDEHGDIDPLWHLRRFNIFDELDSDGLLRITRLLRLHEYARGDTVFLPSDEFSRVYFVIQGRVKISRVDDRTGRELILYILRPGEVFGLIPRGEGLLGDTMAKAMQRSVVGFAEREDFDRLAREAGLCYELHRMMGNRLVRIETRFKDLMFRDVRTRLARLFLQLADDFPGEVSEGKPCIDIELTQQDIAGLIGATREVTSTHMSAFKRNGWITVEEGKILIQDRESLVSIAA